MPAGSTADEDFAGGRGHEDLGLAVAAVGAPRPERHEFAAQLLRQRRGLRAAEGLRGAEDMARAPSLAHRPPP